MKSRMIVLERCLRSTSTRLAGTPSIPKHRSLRGLRFSSYQSRYQSSVATQSSAAWEEMDLPFPGYGLSASTLESSSNATTNNRPTTDAKHCNTCTCKEESSPIAVASNHQQQQEQPFPCGNPHHEDSYGILPPPLPSPEYSVHKRILPPTLTASSSPLGRKYLLEAMSNNSAESYFSLTEQFVNQSDPAFCGVTTLIMVLNAMCVDPQVRWRGGWRYYGSEDVLLDRCCLSAERIRRNGVTLEEFRLLGRCHGLSIDLKRPVTTCTEENDLAVVPSPPTPPGRATLEEFRNDIRRILTQTINGNNNGATDNHYKNSVLVVSFSRASLSQTGDGHFSPLAAYHEASDSVLVLDVARFKYTPYWVGVKDIYHALEPIDPVTNKPRGWFLLHPPQNHKQPSEVTMEDRRPADLVPQVGDGDSCPVGKVKVEFCQANPNVASKALV